MATFTLAFKDAVSIMGGEIITTDNSTYLRHADLVGLMSYPIFDTAYRERLNGMICDRFMNREIGFETVHEFRLKLRSRMNEIMPFYNRMYEADRLEFDPLRTYDIRRIMDGNVDSVTQGESAGSTVDNETTTTDTQGDTSGTSSTSSDTKSRGVSSDTPQTMLKGDEDYASSASDQTGRVEGEGSTREESTATSDTDREAHSDSTATSLADTKTKTKNDSHEFGYQGNPSDLIVAFRNSLVNTDMLVLDDLDICFMQVYDSGDPVSNPFRHSHYPHSTYNRF